jgi:NAD(P)-dependent dehydrogenase (short-subunit alcohol dehydrogenase family)
VTGAAQGIGLATVERLAQDGFRVVAMDRNAERLREEAARYGATEGSSLFDGAHPIDEYSVLGSGYEFQIMQMKFATLRISGECLLLQEVLDLPPGQLPPLK